MQLVSHWHGRSGSARRATDGRSRTGRVVAILVGASVVAASCGGDDDVADDGAAATTDAPATPTPAGTSSPLETTIAASSEMSPQELGDEIGTLYLAVYDDVIATLEDRPEPAEATARLTELEATYIEQFVELGRQREMLDESGRATVDTAISTAIMSLPEETLAEYQAAIDDYADPDAPELSELIRSFNIIGQYASFDLLREQDPDEAARLGID